MSQAEVQSRWWSVLRLRCAVLLATVLVLGMLVSRLPAASAQAALAAQVTDFPIFDTHLHYSQDAWGLFSPQEIVALMDQAGIYRALVSSTPDDGSLMLAQLARTGSSRCCGRTAPAPT